MLKSYHLKRPVYRIWKYEGEEILPKEVHERLVRLCGSVKVVTSQESVPYRYIEITRNGRTFDILKGNYVVFYAKEENGFLVPTLEIRNTISEFEEAKEEETDGRPAKVY